jgi:hypothetical protein
MRPSPGHQAVAAIAAEAGKVFPHEVQRLQRGEAARDTWPATLPPRAVVAGVPARADSLAARVPAKRAELSAQLDTLRVALQLNLASIRNKVEEFAKARRLPPGLEPPELAKVKETLVSAPKEWAAVEAEAKAGELDRALGNATVLRLKVSAALDAVGLVASEAEWHNVKLPPR